MSHKYSRVFVSLLLALTLSLAGFSPALAAAPANDAFAGATLVSIGFSEQLDTSEATTDADDTQLNTDCGAPATDASVWYALQGTDQGVVVDVSQSDYSAGVLVGVGSQGSLQILACGPGAVGFFAASGTRSSSTINASTRAATTVPSVSPRRPIRCCPAAGITRSATFTT